MAKQVLTSETKINIKLTMHIARSFGNMSADQTLDVDVALPNALQKFTDKQMLAHVCRPGSRD